MAGTGVNCQLQLDMGGLGSLFGVICAQAATKRKSGYVHRHAPAAPWVNSPGYIQSHGLKETQRGRLTAGAQ